MVNVINGFFFGGSNGYDLLNFVYIYFIGFIIKRYKIQNNFIKTQFLISYIFISILAGITRIFISRYDNDIAADIYNYNEPLIVISSILLMR